MKVMKKQEKEGIKGIKNKKEERYERISRNSSNRTRQGNGKNYRGNTPNQIEKIDESTKAEAKARALQLIGEGISALSNDTRFQLARYIQKNKEASFDELRIKFKLNNNSLNFHLKNLQKSYIVFQSKSRGSYQLGKLGEVMLDLLDALEANLTSALVHLSF